jgi:hypothetical protein
MFDRFATSSRNPEHDRLCEVQTLPLRTNYAAYNPETGAGRSVAQTFNVLGEIACEEFAKNFNE